MIAYAPGDTLAHRLDPRSKVAFQFGLAVFAVAHATPRGLAASFALALLALATARLSPLRALRAYWVILAVLALGPVIAGLTLGPPWVRADPALASLASVLRIVPILLVSAAFVHATPVRDVRAAIQWAVPGRLGRLLGVGVGLTIRFVPVVRGDVAAARDAIRARGGDARPFYERAGRIALLSVQRALARADALAVALRARAFSYNPTLPELRFRSRDVPVVLAGVTLAVSPLVPGLPL